MQLLRKITIKSCGDFTKKRILSEILKDKKEGEKVAIIRIAGECNKAESGQTDKGAFTRLGGSFIGTDLTTGAVYASGQCILPDYIGAQIGTAVMSSKGATAEFAFEIFVHSDESSITGYVFTVGTLLAMKPTSSMERLMKIAGIVPPPAPEALAAPATDPAPAAAPAADPAPAAPPAAGKSKK